MAWVKHWYLVIALLVIVTGCATVPPGEPSGLPPAARVSTSQDDPPQKLLFSPYIRFRGDSGKAGSENYWILPGGWNAYHDACGDDWCWGVIEMPDRHVIRWASGMVSADLNGPDVVWKRTDDDRPRLTYGLVRLPSGQEQLSVQAGGLVVLSVVVRSEGDITRTLQFARSLASTSAPCRDCVRPRALTQPQTPTQLDSRNGRPVPSKYEGIRDAKDWLNPYLAVCPQGVDLTVASAKSKSLVSISDLRAALIKLPLAAWPYGRIVGLQECSLGIPGDEQARRDRLAAVEAVLKALGLEISRWPA